MPSSWVESSPNSWWKAAAPVLTPRSVEAARRVGLGLHVGLHAGDVIREGGDIFGGAVNLAARVAAEAPAGQVLASETVRGLARTSAPVAFAEAGARRLKGIAEPVRLFSVTAS